jgi:hypothetical protein
MIRTGSGPAGDRGTLDGAGPDGIVAVQEERTIR